MEKPIEYSIGFSAKRHVWISFLQGLFSYAYSSVRRREV